MAGLFLVAGMVMIDRHRQKKQAKEAKIIYNDIRYAALQEETRQRLSYLPQSSSDEDASFEHRSRAPSLAPSDTHERRLSRMPSPATSSSQGSDRRISTMRNYTYSSPSSPPRRLSSMQSSPALRFDNSHPEDHDEQSDDDDIAREKSVAKRQSMMKSQRSKWRQSIQVWRHKKGT